MSRQDLPQDIESQRSAQRDFKWYSTLEQARSFPQKGRATEDGTSTTLTRSQSRRTSV